MRNMFKIHWTKKTRVPIDGFLMELLVDLNEGDPKRIKAMVERGVVLAAHERADSWADLDRLGRIRRYLEKRDRPLKVV